MKYLKINIIVLLIIILPQDLYMQSDSLEIFIIDAYVTPENRTLLI